MQGGESVLFFPPTVQGIASTGEGGYLEGAEADPGFWSGGPQRSFDPRGGPEPKICSKLFENCIILKKILGQGGVPPLNPLVVAYVGLEKLYTNNKTRTLHASAARKVFPVGFSFVFVSAIFLALIEGQCNVICFKTQMSQWHHTLQGFPFLLLDYFSPKESCVPQQSHMEYKDWNKNNLLFPLSKSKCKMNEWNCTYWFTFCAILLMNALKWEIVPACGETISGTDLLIEAVTHMTALAEF